MDAEKLKNKTFKGIIWKFLERFFAQFISLVVSVILARLLSPSDYAPISIITIFFTFADVFISSGLNTALIQKKNVEKDDYSTIFVFSFIVSLIIYLLIFIGAPVIANIYHQPILVTVFRVMGIVLIINSAKSVICAYVSSRLLFKKFFWSSISGTLISAVVGIVLAYRGYGVWALVAQQLSNSIIDTMILFITTEVRFSFRFSIKRLRELYKFGFNIFIASFVGTIYDQISPLVIGLKFSPTDLSFYEKGRSFPSLINSAFNDSISAVVFPAMSKVQDEKNKILIFTRRFMQLSSFLIFPLMIGFFCVSDEFVLLVLSNKWLGASDYIKIFCLCYLFNIIQNGNLQAIKAIGRSDIVLKLEVIKKTVYLVVLITIIIISESPVFIAVASVINTVIATVVNTYPNRKLIGYSYRMQLVDLLPNLINALFMGFCVYVVGRIISIGPIGSLIIQILTGFIVYIAGAIISNNSNLKYLLNLLGDILNGRIKSESKYIL